MPFGIGNLNFIDDTIDSIMGGVDDLFTSEKERKILRNKLAKMKAELKIKAQAHTRKIAEIHAKDRQQARSVQQKSLEKAWWMMPTLAILAFLGFFAVLGALMFVDVPQSGRAALNIMLGSLGSLVMLIGHFLWGSSQGSKDKADHIRELTSQMSYKDAPPQNNTSTSSPLQTKVRGNEIMEAPDLDNLQPAKQAKPAPPDKF